MSKQKLVVAVITALLVIGICVAAAVWMPSLFEMVKRMHGM